MKSADRYCSEIKEFFAACRAGHVRYSDMPAPVRWPELFQVPYADAEERMKPVYRLLHEEMTGLAAVCEARTAAKGHRATLDNFTEGTMQ